MLVLQKTQSSQWVSVLQTMLLRAPPQPTARARGWAATSVMMWWHRWTPLWIVHSSSSAPSRGPAWPALQVRLFPSGPSPLENFQSCAVMHMVCYECFAAGFGLQNCFWVYFSIDLTCRGFCCSDSKGLWPLPSRNCHHHVAGICLGPLEDGGQSASPACSRSSDYIWGELKLVVSKRCR